MKPAATLATFADFRIVKTRKLAQFVFEVPIESADEALTALGGLPRSDGERWCGIALIERVGGEDGESQRTVNPPVNDVAGSSPAQPTKPKRRFSELPRSAQAAMLCENPVFQMWLMGHGRYDYALRDEREGNGPVREKADSFLKGQLQIESKTEIDRDQTIAARFDALHARYRSQTGQEAEAR